MISTSNRLLVVIICLALALSAYAQSPREQLQQLTVQLQQTPNDTALRERIIKLGTEIKPAPVVPEEARRPFVEGVTILKSANDAGSQKLAIGSFHEALKIAPWWGDAYYNLAVAQELTGQLDDAERTLKWFMLSNPGEIDAREAQDRVYAIGAKRKMAAAAKQEQENLPEARAAREAARKKEAEHRFIASLEGAKFDCSPQNGDEMAFERWIEITNGNIRGIQQLTWIAPGWPPDWKIGLKQLFISPLPLQGRINYESKGDQTANVEIYDDRLVFNVKFGMNSDSGTCRRR